MAHLWRRCIGSLGLTPQPVHSGLGLHPPGEAGRMLGAGAGEGGLGPAGSTAQAHPQPLHAGPPAGTRTHYERGQLYHRTQTSSKRNSFRGEEAQKRLRLGPPNSFVTRDLTFSNV